MRKPWLLSPSIIMMNTRCLTVAESDVGVASSTGSRLLDKHRDTLLHLDFK